MERDQDLAQPDSSPPSQDAVRRNHSEPRQRACPFTAARAKGIETHRLILRCGEIFGLRLK